MAKAISGQYGPYYSPLYSGLKTDLARKQAQGKLTSGAPPMSPEDYQAAYLGITEGEQKARQTQAEYDLRQQQLDLQALQGERSYELGRQGLALQRSAQQNPVTGAINLAYAGMIAPQALTNMYDLYKKILPGTTRAPTNFAEIPLSYDEFYGGISPLDSLPSYFSITGNEQDWLLDLLQEPSWLSLFEGGGGV